MFGNLMNRMNPTACLAPCGMTSTYSDDENTVDNNELDSIVPRIIEVISDTESPPDARTNALRKLYELTDVKYRENRVSLVCTSKWDVVAKLSTCISASSMEPEGDEDRRLACLTLNNLSIPLENKALMALSAGADTLLISLTHVIRTGLPQCYLCLTCLMNISFLEDAAKPIIYFSPTLAVEGRVKRSRQLHHNPLDDPNSLLRIIEKKMEIYSPYLSKNVFSVEAEAVRWSVGLLRNLSKTDAHATLISRTEMPRLIVSYIKNCQRPVVKWTKDSLEEMSLQVLCNLVRWPKSKRILSSVNTVEAMEPILGAGGIHDFRAGMIKYALESYVAPQK